MKHLYFLLSGLFFYAASYAQPRPVRNIAWEWVSGENTENSLGDYGTQGVEQKTNVPLARSFPAGWTDKDGNLWMFGGMFDKEKFLNDVWMYKPLQDIWVWVTGDNVPDQPGAYAKRGFSFKNKPGARRGALSWTDKDGNFWLFGGYGVDVEGNKGRLNDLWQYIPNKGWAWMSGDETAERYGRYGTLQQASKDNFPGAREGATGWTDDKGNLWMFGGEGRGEDNNGVLNDLWMFDTNDQVWIWMGGSNLPDELGRYTQKKLEDKYNQPGARKYTASWKDSKGIFWLFGGNGYASQGNGYLNDMWTFNTRTLQWTWMGGESYINKEGYYYVIGNSSSKSYPGARSGGVSWYDANGNVWLFGGWGIDGQYQSYLLNDLWKFEPNDDAWTWVSGSNSISAPGTYGIKGEPDTKNTPGARVVSLGWMDKTNTRWLFGGAGYATQQGGYLNDLWAIDRKRPATLSCPSSVVISNDSLHCAIPVNNIDPITSKDAKIKFQLSGATTWVSDGSASGLTFNKGTTTVLYALADNLQQSCSFTVTVEDHSKPVPVVKQLPDITGQCSVKVNNVPAAIDNCSGEIKGTTQDPVSYSKEGEYIIHWSYDDGNGNVAQQLQKVIIKNSDQLSPVITSLPDIIAECSVEVNTVPQATKNCGGFIDGKTSSPLSYSKQGNYTIVWKYDDGNGHTAEQSQRIIIRDTTAPVPVVKQLADIIANCAVTIKDIPVAIDNCAAKIAAATANPLTYDKEGEYIIQWLYDDGNGNTARQVQKVIVKRSDKLSPVLASLPDIVGECSATITDIPQASQNCGGFIKGKTSFPLTYNSQGEYTVVWTFNDGNGHTAEQVQKIIVKDTRAPEPIIKQLPDIIANCAVTIKNIPLAKDNCSGEITGVTTDPLNYTQQGEYSITWMYKDDNGNVSKQVQKVIIKRSDELTPVLESLPGITGQCSVTITDIPEASQNCGGFIIGKTTAPLTYTKQGIYTVLWIYDDGKGHTAEQTQMVTVKDTEAPVPLVKTLPDITGGCTLKITSIPKAADNCAGEIGATTQDALEYSKQGEYIINWKYSDGNGNTSTQQQKVILKSDGARLSPVVSSLPDIYAGCTATVTEIPQAIKDCGGFIKAKTKDALTYNIQGEHTITWTYEDGNGYSIQQQQKVIIKDTSAPVPLVKELPDISGECSITVNDTPEAMDNCGGKIKATTSKPLVYKKNGEYIITWKYDDGNGNTSTQYQKIILRSSPGSLAPSINILPDIEGTCSVIILIKPTAKDRCIGTIVGTTADPLYYGEPGEYIVHWKFAGTNDTIMQEQKVIVKSLAADVAVFPNPSTNHFTISFKSCKREERVSFIVFDVLGRALETKEVNANWPVTFGTTYPTGTYFIQIKQGNETIIKKIIKLK